MDQLIRSLHRRYLTTGSTEDGVAYLRGATRANYPIQLNELTNQVLIPFKDSLFSPSNIYIGSRSGVDLLRIWQQLIRRMLGDREDQPLVYAVLCRNEPNVEVDVIYRAMVFTVARTPVECHECQTMGPHLCESFKHPYADGYDLPIPTEAEINDSRDPVIERTWYPSQESRHMEQIYRYDIYRWVLESEQKPLFQGLDSLESTSRFVCENGWCVVQGLNYIAASFEDVALPVKVAESLKRTVLNYSDHQTPNSRTVCFPIYNNIGSLPQKSPHEPIEQAPVLDTGPCEDYRVVPGGQIAFEGRRVIFDETTLCGHGHTDEPNIEHLCPPMWTDGAQAGWRCNSCRKLLGLRAGEPGYLVICDTCSHPPRASEPDPDEEESNSSIFVCACGEEYEDEDEALECCDGDIETRSDI